jgi:hypothetical protein
MKQNTNSVFATLSAINLNDKVEKKKDLTYLSWTYAWSEVKKIYPDAQYEVKFFDGYPFVEDDNLGYMVFTTVTIEGQTHMMWLPVMDGANKSMKSEEYTYDTRYGQKTVEKASMFDINKTIMRCLVKNLAMFGLGIYIFAGEDLPDGDSAPAAQVTTNAKIDLVVGDANWAKVAKFVSDNKQLTFESIIQQLERKYTINSATKKELSKLVN